MATFSQREVLRIATARLKEQILSDSHEGKQLINDIMAQGSLHKVPDISDFCFVLERVTPDALVDADDCGCYKTKGGMPKYD